MSKDKENILDSFYNVPEIHKKKETSATKSVQRTKVVTYSLKEDNIRYVDLRATHFGSKSAFINHLIECDMKEHSDIVEMTKALATMK